MAKAMPNLVGRLQASFAEAREFVEAIEKSKRQQTGRRKTLSTNDVRFSYELAYLKVFSAWENFLEESFFRYLAGYSHSGGQQTLVPPHTFSRNVHAAETRVLTDLGRPYLLWHNADDVIRRSRRYFVHGKHEDVLDSVLSRMESFSAVRHHIAHMRRDTAVKFDRASLTLCGHQMGRSRPGSFLRREVQHMVPRTTWLELIMRDLQAYAVQITP